MKNLDTVSIGDFQAWLGEKFIVEPENEDGIDLELIQVKPVGLFKPDVVRRQSFSVLFRGPLEPRLTQHSYRIENVVFGKHMLFLVPVGADEEGILYDATFTWWPNAKSISARKLSLSMVATPCADRFLVPLLR